MIRLFGVDEIPIALVGFVGMYGFGGDHDLSRLPEG